MRAFLAAHCAAETSRNTNIHDSTTILAATSRLAHVMAVSSRPRPGGAPEAQPQLTCRALPAPTAAAAAAVEAGRCQSALLGGAGEGGRGTRSAALPALVLRRCSRAGGGRALLLLRELQILQRIFFLFSLFFLFFLFMLSRQLPLLLMRTPPCMHASWLCGVPPGNMRAAL